MMLMNRMYMILAMRTASMREAFYTVIIIARYGLHVMATYIATVIIMFHHDMVLVLDSVTGLVGIMILTMDIMIHFMPHIITLMVIITIHDLIGGIMADSMVETM